MDLRKFHPPFCQKNGFRSSSPHPKNTCGFPSPATPKTRSGFVFFSFTTHKVYEFHFPQHHDLKICAPPYPNTILLLFLSATRRLNLKYVSPPAHPQPETVSLGAATQNTYLFCSPQLHDTKYFDPSLSQFAPKICRFRFPQPCRPKIIWASSTLPSASGIKNHTCFVPLSLTTQNVSILPSASLHQKYADFFSLTLVDQNHLRYASLSLRIQKPYLFLFLLVSRYEIF